MSQSLSRHSSFNLLGQPALRNRLVVPPMASQTAEFDGIPDAETFAHYERLGESRPGLLWVEYTAVTDSGRGEPRQTVLADQAAVPAYAQLARIIRRSGAKAGIQLVHAGGKSSAQQTGGRLLAPSAVAIPVKGQELEVPEALTADEVHGWRHSFVKSASLAVAAGFEWIQLHAAHGYGLNQFLSPITNHREDEFGGSLENRSRLLIETAAEIKRRHPGVGLAVRLAAQDHLPQGLTLAESAWIARKLGEVGVDLIDVSSGLGGWRRPDARNGEGYLIADAAFIRRESAMPVIGVGGIETGEYMDSILRAGLVDLVAVGRAVLRDPALFRKTQMEERNEEVHGDDVHLAAGIC